MTFYWCYFVFFFGSYIQTNSANYRSATRHILLPHPISATKLTAG